VSDVRILVTNDDGIHGPGLRALALGLVEHGYDVVVVGPPGQHSGAGASLGTVEHQAMIVVTAPTVAGLERLETLAVEGPPALAVRAVCSGALGQVPDLVVSGINPGFNGGRTVLHSGTVGAATTAASLDVCGIAMSTDDDPAHGFATAARVAGWVVQAAVAAGLPPVALNVNVPDLALAQVGGVEEGAFGSDSVSGISFDRTAHGLVVRRTTAAPPFMADTDSDRLAHGLVSISHVPLPWRPSWDATGVIDAVRARLHGG
jgi:5'-nucleotidase